MATTQSGFTVIPAYGDPRIVKTAPVNSAPGVLKELTPIFEWVMARFAATVAPLKPAQCWGYAPRQIRGGTGWSNHASGSAIDLNSGDFPQGEARMTAAQKKACRAIVAASGGVLRWGGDYVGVALDQQHFEINDRLAGTSRLTAFIKTITAATAATTQEDDMADALDKKVTLTDYRGRFTDGKSPKVTKSLEDFIGNTWEFTKYTAGLLDSVSARLDAIEKKLGIK